MAGMFSAALKFTGRKTVYTDDAADVDGAVDELLGAGGEERRPRGAR